MNFVLTIIRCEGMYEMYYARRKNKEIGKVHRICGASREELVNKFEVIAGEGFRKVYCIDATERRILINNSRDTFNEINIICITDYRMSERMLELVRYSKSGTVSAWTAGLHKTYNYFFDAITKEKTYYTEAH